MNLEFIIPAGFLLKRKVKIKLGAMIWSYTKNNKGIKKIKKYVMIRILQVITSGI